MPMICILGRQPEIGMAELESRFGPDGLSALRPDVALLESFVEPARFEQFGSIQKAAELISTDGTADWHKLSSHLKKTVSSLLETAPEGKITLGISTYGLRTSPSQINAAALALKKIIKQAGRPSRIVPNKEPALNTAQVLHNKLAVQGNIELLLVQNGSRVAIARTVWVQDIEAYRRRDQERPFRDARVGMLPPKLAQIIINLSIGRGSAPSETADIPISLNFNELKISDTLLDPFCGTGVVLQEALLMGITAYGTDLEPRMAEYTTKNLEWLSQKTKYKIEEADATTYTWIQPINVIAAETYLGRPLSSRPDHQTLLKIVHDCNVIHKKFLQNVARQTKSGFRMCIAVPAWHDKHDFTRLPVLDRLEELGYNRVSFSFAKTSDLVYHREGQIVARELVVLTRK